MQIFKKSMLGIVVLLFITTLFLFGLGFGLLKVFGNADSIKGALSRSGVYQSVVEDALRQAQKGQTGTSEGQIPLDQPEVQNIIKNAASPELLQAQTENALDSFYAWVHGETPTLAFNLEVADVKTNLARGIEQYVTQHAASLPACAPGQTEGAADNPFSATCRPEGVDPAQLAAQAKSEFLSSEFLKDTTISADTIKDEKGQTLTQKFGEVPNAYKAASWSVYGTGLLALLLAAGVVLLSVNWRSGVKKLSIIIIVLGTLSAGFGWLTRIGMGKAAEAAKEPLQQSGIKVAEALVGDLRSWWLWYGIALVVAGVAALVALHFLKSKSAAPTDMGKASRPEPTGEPLPPQTMPTHTSVETPDKPKPVKKLVQ